jgi:hypothetical protein
VQPPVVLKHAAEVHRMPSAQLLLPVQVTSHAHESPHVMARHDEGPEHATSHGPSPHSTLRQDCEPLHSTVHDVDIEQSTPLRHELSILHWMSHA